MQAQAAGASIHKSYLPPTLTPPSPWMWNMQAKAVGASIQKGASVSYNWLRDTVNNLMADSEHAGGAGVCTGSGSDSPTDMGSRGGRGHWLSFLAKGQVGYVCV